MHPASLVAAIVLLANSASAASFDAPSQLNGDVEARPVWLLLLMGPGDEMRGAVRSDPQVTATEFRAQKFSIDLGPLRFHDVREVDNRSETLEGLDAALESSAGSWKSIYLEADSIAVQVTANGQFSTAAAGSEVLDVLPEQAYPDGIVRPFGPLVQADSAAVVAALPAPALVTIRFEGLRGMELHNITATCLGACPRQSEATSLGQPMDGRSSGIHSLNYLRMATVSGEGALGGQVSAFALGGPALDVAVVGQVRLAGFVVDQCAADACVSSLGQTLVADGTIELSNLRMNEGGGLEGELALTSAKARLDEDVFDAGILAPAAVIGSTVAIAGVLLVKALGLLFTRIRPPEALANQRRRVIYETIQRTAGLSIAALVRRTGLARSTVDHHVNVLVRVGLIERLPLGKSVRLFPRGVDLASRRGLAVLQDSCSQSICELVAATPGITQTNILDALAEIPRSSVQFQLKRLHDHDVLSRTKVGRRVHYGPGQFFQVPTAPPEPLLA